MKLPRSLSKKRGIALGGGGITAIAHAGALEYLSDIGMIDRLEYFSGSSAGSIVAMILACRIDPKKISDVLLGMDFSKLEDNSWFLPKDIYRVWKKFGWNRSENLGNWLKGILKREIGNEDITFKEVKEKFGSFLIVTATDIGFKNTIYYSPESTPNMKVHVAVTQSCSMPIFFTPYSDPDLNTSSSDDSDSFNESDNKPVEGNLYVDGGLLDNYPIGILYNYLSEDEVFGIKLMTSQEISNRTKRTLSVPTNFKDYCTALIVMLRQQALKLHVKQGDWGRTIAIDVGDISSIQFDLSQPDKDKLFNSGKDAATDFVESFLD